MTSSLLFLGSGGVARGGHGLYHSLLAKGRSVIIVIHSSLPEVMMAKGCYLLFCQWRVVIVTHSHSKREVGKVWPWHHSFPPWGVEECDHAHPLLLPERSRKEVTPWSYPFPTSLWKWEGSWPPPHFQKKGRVDHDLFPSLLGKWRSRKG